MFEHDPKYIWFKKHVNEYLTRHAGVTLRHVVEPYPGFVEGNYCQGISPELTAMDIIEVNVDLGYI